MTAEKTTSHVLWICISLWKLDYFISLIVSK